MKKQDDIMKQPSSGGFDIPGNEMKKDQERPVQENQEMDFSILGSHDHNAMSEVIRKWESFRFII
jgi:hypothetical protein